jgi:bifunctional non-homologous end joining protein LigD
MLAVAGELPPRGEDAAWGYEFKWDGVRALAAVRGGRLGLWARSGTEITTRYPEISRLPEALIRADVVLDGEVVALDRRGRPDFGLLQNRMHRTGGPDVARLAAADPVTYLVFDVLTVAGRSLLDRPYEARRERLEDLDAAGSAG